MPNALPLPRASVPDFPPECTLAHPGFVNTRGSGASSRLPSRGVSSLLLSSDLAACMRAHNEPISAGFCGIPYLRRWTRGSLALGPHSLKDGNFISLRLSPWAPACSVFESLFQSEEGGLQTSVAGPCGDLALGREICFFGVIDILQQYNTTKRAEHFFKSFAYDKVLQPASHV